MRLMDKGVDDLDGISRATGSCSGCGACDTDILEIFGGTSFTSLRKSSGQTSSTYPQCLISTLSH